MKVHFIAIGGAAMHNLAIALHLKGYNVSGSDDEIFEPSKSRLHKHGLLPKYTGWFPQKISPSIDAVILGMHAKKDNPELLRAKELGVKIFSYPEFLYEQAKNKKRVVIGGSHGKTTITSMILHVLHQLQIEHDYMVGAQLEGFDVMVKISETAPVMILEGDEYLTSPLDLRPKFHVYQADIALISGIAWDHINVFPTFEEYIDQFKIFANLISKNGSLIYCEDDPEVNKIGQNARSDIEAIGYHIPRHRIEGTASVIQHNGKSYPLQIFGDHNLMNLNGARLVCNKLGISSDKFYQSIMSFKGASKRLQLIGKNNYSSIYKDFAHAPSKLKATVSALKKQYPDRRLIACLELHTYSSLNKQFLPQYKGTIDQADIAVVYYNQHTLQLKRLPDISPEDIIRSFDREDLIVITDSAVLKNFLVNQDPKLTNYLLMSSGSFDNLDFDKLCEQILHNLNG